MIRVVLPQHLQTLARCEREVTVSIATGPASTGAILDALELRFPMLRGTTRDHLTHKRRPRVRFFAAGEDISHDSPEAELPPSIASGEQPFMIVGAVAGG